ncbi:hypothetical protein [Gordonia aichiensis]
MRVRPRRSRHTGAARRAWEVAHVIATVAVPWALAVYYLRSDVRSIDGSARLVADFHRWALLGAGVVLISGALLRISGRSPAATVPFAIVWLLGIAFSITQIHQYSGKYVCTIELCMPDFGLFVTAVPFAVALSLSVAGSIIIDRVCRSRDPMG